MKIRIKIIIALLGLLLFLPPTLYSQEIFEAGERKPFNAETVENQKFLNNAPAKAPETPILPPPPEDQKVGGAPIEDACLLMLLLAIGYGIFAPKSPEGDFGEQKAQENYK